MILYKIRLANTKKSMQKILVIIGIVMNSIIANGCKKYQEPENEIYDVLTGATADRGYPMDMYHGYLEYENDVNHIPIGDGHGYLSTGFLYNHIVGWDKYRAPDSLDIRWFSITEDKFYEGKFKFSEELKQKMKTFSKEKSILLNFVLLPKGQIWLYMKDKNRELVQKYQAQETSVLGDKEFTKRLFFTGYERDIIHSRKEYIESTISKLPAQTQKEVAEGTIPTDYWEKLDKRYLWNFKITPSILGEIEVVNKEKGYINFLNAELFSFSALKKERAIPIYIEYESAIENSYEFTTRIYLTGVPGKEDMNYLPYEQMRAREQELIKLFSDFYEKIGRKEFEIYLKLDDMFVPKGLYLKHGEIEQKIPNVYIEAFNDTFDKELYIGVM